MDKPGEKVRLSVSQVPSCLQATVAHEEGEWKVARPCCGTSEDRDGCLELQGPSVRTPWHTLPASVVTCVNCWADDLERVGSS